MNTNNKVSLSKAELEMISKLPESQREAVSQSLLQAKAEAMASVTERREVFSVRITDKGGVSVYGLGQRFPVTLYPEQWEIVAENLETILATASKAPKRKAR
jgi:hypothetical protein